MTNRYESVSTMFGPEFRKIRAREQFFIDRQRPSGMVSEPVIQSWERCLSKGRSIQEIVSPKMLPGNELKNSLRRSHRIIDAAEPELRNLEASLAHTGCSVSLINPAGVVIRSSPEHMASGKLARQLSRPGVDMSEDAIGTSAPGIVLQSGKAAFVDCAEHYFLGHTSMRCAAAPIVDRTGGLAGVLNIAIESHAFGFDPTAIVAMYASLIENRLLRVQPVGYRLIEFHFAPGAIGSGFAGLAGVRPDGRVDWTNRVGAQLLGVSLTPNLDVETVFGLTLQELRELSGLRYNSGMRRCLPNGLTVLMSTSGADGRDSLSSTTEIHVVQTDDPPGKLPTRAGVQRNDRLADQEKRLILETMAAAEGNVSRAARRLGVSRGKIYRVLGAKFESS